MLALAYLSAWYLQPRRPELSSQAAAASHIWWGIAGRPAACTAEVGQFLWHSFMNQCHCDVWDLGGITNCSHEFWMYRGLICRSKAGPSKHNQGWHNYQCEHLTFYSCASVLTCQAQTLANQSPPSLAHSSPETKTHYQTFTFPRLHRVWIISPS